MTSKTPKSPKSPKSLKSSRELSITAHIFEYGHPINRVFKKGRILTQVEKDCMTWDRYILYIVERGWDAISARRGVDFDSLSPFGQEEIHSIVVYALSAVMEYLKESGDDPELVLEYLLSE